VLYILLPICIVGALVLVWRVAGEDDRAIVRRVASHLQAVTGPSAGPHSRWKLVVRVFFGVILILIGATGKILAGYLPGGSRRE